MIGVLKRQWPMRRLYVLSQKELSLLEIKIMINKEGRYGGDLLDQPLNYIGQYMIIVLYLYVVRLLSIYLSLLLRMDMFTIRDYLSLPLRNIRILASYNRLF